MPSNRDTRRVTVVFGSETSEAERGFRRVRDSADQVEGRTSRLSQAFDKLGPGILAAVGAESIGVAFNRVIQGASNLNETISKTQQTFKTSSTEILKWSEGSARSMGMSKQAALDNVSAFGNMYQQIGLTEKVAGQMSTRMVQLSSDFASFHNADPAAVMEALLSATRGEYDALQKFVPTVNAAAIQTEALAATHKKTAASLTDAEKATALYNLVLKNAGSAQGDFGRTADSAANQQRILAATLEDSAAKIGQVVLPAYQGLLTIINDVGPIKFAILGLAIAFSGKLTSALNGARTATTGWLTSIRASVTAATTATGSTSRFGNALAGIRGAAAAASTGLRDVWDNTSGIAKLGTALAAANVAASSMGTDATPQIAALTNALDQFGKTGNASGEAMRTFGADMSRFEYDVQSAGTGALAKTGNAISGIIENVTGLGSVFDETLQHATERLNGIDQALAEMVGSGNVQGAQQAFDRLAAVAAKQGVSVNDLRLRFKEYTAALETSGYKANASGANVDKFTKQIETLKPALQGSSTDAKTYSDALLNIGKMGENTTTQLSEYTAVLSGVETSQLTSSEKGKLFSETLGSIDNIVAPLTDKGKTLATVFNRIGDAQITAKQKGDLLKQTLDQLYGAQIGQVEANESAITSRDSLSESLRKNGQQFDINAGKTEAQRQKILANRDALQAALIATRDKYVADIQAGDSADVARGKYEKARDAVLSQISPTKRTTSAVKELVTKYGEIPRARTTKIAVDGDTAALIAMLKSFALQRGLAEKWTKDQVNSYYNGLYTTYVRGDSGNMNPRVNPGQSLFATGGMVPGWSPHNKADNIAAWLTAREFVQPVDAVDYYGIGAMEALRKKKIPADLMRAAAQGVIPDAYAGGARGYASGGIAGGSTWPVNVPFSATNPVSLTSLRRQFEASLLGFLGGATGPGGWQWQVATVRKMFPGIGVYSTYRPGSTTLSGNRSYHSIGRAVDFQPMRKAAEWIAATYGKNTKELITPWRDLMLWHGRPHKYSHAIEAQHGVFGNNAHLHWAYDQGGVLPPGMTMAHNNTGRSEYVLTGEQLANARGVTVNVTVQGNVTTEKDLAESISTSVRDALLRKASRNGGKTGL